jgi:hypothetical protein
VQRPEPLIGPGERCGSTGYDAMESGLSPPPTPQFSASRPEGQGAYQHQNSSEDDSRHLADIGRVSDKAAELRPRSRAKPHLQAAVHLLSYGHVSSPSGEEDALRGRSLPSGARVRSSAPAAPFSSAPSGMAAGGRLCGGVLPRDRKRSSGGAPCRSRSLDLVRSGVLVRGSPCSGSGSFAWGSRDMCSFRRANPQDPAGCGPCPSTAWRRLLSSPEPGGRQGPTA